MLPKPCLGSAGHCESAVSGQRVRFSSESQEVLKYLQAKESNDFSSYLNGSSNFFMLKFYCLLDNRSGLASSKPEFQAVFDNEELKLLI